MFMFRAGCAVFGIWLGWGWDTGGWLIDGRVGCPPLFCGLIAEGWSAFYWLLAISRAELTVCGWPRGSWNTCGRPPAPWPGSCFIGRALTARVWSNMPSNTQEPVALFHQAAMEQPRSSSTIHTSVIAACQRPRIPSGPFGRRRLVGRLWCWSASGVVLWTGVRELHLVVYIYMYFSMSNIYIFTSPWATCWLGENIRSRTEKTLAPSLETWWGKERRVERAYWMGAAGMVWLAVKWMICSPLSAEKW